MTSAMSSTWPRRPAGTVAAMPAARPATEPGVALPDRGPRERVEEDVLGGPSDQQREPFDPAAAAMPAARRGACWPTMRGLPMPSYVVMG
jgi:hypothetical protein